MFFSLYLFSIVISVIIFGNRYFMALSVRLGRAETVASCEIVSRTQKRLSIHSAQNCEKLKSKKPKKKMLAKLLTSILYVNIKSFIFPL